MNTSPLQHRQGGPASVRRLRSLWPPVGPIERQEMNRRGPGMRPDSTAVLAPQSAPPASRTVSQAEISKLREEVGAGPDTIVVGFVGRLEEVKGVDRLIEAYRTWARPDTRLVIVGDGGERKQLMAQADGEPTIRFIGHSKAVDAWYGAMDLVVLPSRWEGLPLVPLEAMQAGAPILASACAGTSEALEGSPATLVPQGQGPLTAALGELLVRARNRDLPRLNYDLSKFNADRSTAAIESFYRSVLS